MATDYELVYRQLIEASPAADWPATVVFNWPIASISAAPSASWTQPSAGRPWRATFFPVGIAPLLSWAARRGNRRRGGRCSALILVPKSSIGSGVSARSPTRFRSSTASPSPTWACKGSCVVKRRRSRRQARRARAEPVLWDSPAGAGERVTARGPIGVSILRESPECRVRRRMKRFTQRSRLAARYRTMRVGQLADT